MAALPRSLAETCFSLREFAYYVGKHVHTARKWFEKDPQVIRMPRASQRDQILIPILYALERGRQMGIPEEMLQEMVVAHRERRNGELRPPARPTQKQTVSAAAKTGHIKIKAASKSRAGR